MKKTDTIYFNLQFVVENGEDYKTEFKQKVDTSLAKEITAFANSAGGKIYIGITDKGEIKGINITNQLKSRIEDIAKNCDPKISISIQTLKKDKILIIEVPESNNKPHRCSSGFYIRSGASSQKLSRDEILDFAEKEDLINFDRQICKEFSFKKDFDKKKLFNFMDKTGIKYNKKNYIQLLENLKVAKRRGSKIIFNNTGVLFFAKDLSRSFFHTTITCGLFKGTEKVHVLDSARFNTDLAGNIEGAIDFLWKNLRARHEIIPRTARRINVLEIPDKALREALINAVTHRNYVNRGPFIQVEIYDDRIEISNFGSLPKGLKRAEFGKRSVPRNQLIANLMLRAKYTEQMGTGIKKMRQLIKREGLPPIKFEFTNFTTVTFYRKPLPGFSVIKSDKEIKTDHLTTKLSSVLSIQKRKAHRLLQILNHIEKSNFSRVSFAKSYNIALRTLNRQLACLKQNNFIAFEGSKRSGKYTVTEKYKKLKNQLIVRIDKKGAFKQG